MINFMMGQLMPHPIAKPINNKMPSVERRGEELGMDTSLGLTRNYKRENKRGGLYAK